MKALLYYIDIDTTLVITEVPAKKLDPKFRPTTGLRQMVMAKLLGRKD